jgi:lipopolysaccharide export system protein LptC
MRPGRSDQERAFRAATRHSRRVRFLRIGIPVAVVGGLIIAGLVTTLLNPLRLLAKLPVDIGSVVVSGTKIMMQQPRVAGFTKDNRRYDLTAQAAGQDLTKPDFLELQGIHATMETQDSGQFDTTARAGLYNTKTEQLTLSDHVVVTSGSGYRALLSEALIDVKAGHIISEKPVEVTTATMTVNANRLEVLENGDLMRFERGVVVLMVPESAAPVSSAEARRR